MKINFNPISFSQNINQKNYTNHTNKLERTPHKDCVSFSGKKPHQKTLKPRIQTAVNYSQDILNKGKEKNLSLNDISDITSKYSENVTVLPMSELKNKIPDADNYGAFFFAQMDSNFKPSSKEMYIKLPQENADDMEMLLFAMNSAHEFTHIEQMDTNEAFNQLKVMSKGNYEYAKAIMGIGDTIFAFFDNQIQAQTVSPLIYKSIDVNTFKKYSAITPVATPITREMLPKSCGAKNEKDMQQTMRKTYQSLFENAMISIKQNQPEILDMIPENETYESLIKKVRSYCAAKAVDEREAYTTESEVAKKAMGISKTLNIDVFPMYYDILSKAFE